VVFARARRPHIIFPKAAELSGRRRNGESRLKKPIKSIEAPAAVSGAVLEGVAVPVSARNAFAVIHTWPDLKNAEYEVLQRILSAAENIGADAIVIDDNGKVLWAGQDSAASPGKALNADLVEFVLSLHFLSPRVIDKYSYYAIWQPIEFYHDFGYHGSIAKFATHLDLISCASDLADAHALNIFSALGRQPPLPLPQMYHTLPEPFLEPRISNKSRLFYIGINWERLGRPKGRFHDVLNALDSKDLLDIYGPEKLHGVAPWAGFESYRGELPFDGLSVKDAINRAGICLALSSLPHKNAGIMSNRLFEGLAGGAAVIATPNPLIDKLFKDVVYLVDDTRGEEILGQQVLQALHRIRDRPEEARERVLLGQNILREKCSLEGSLSALLEETRGRQQHFQSIFLTDASVTVILDARKAAIEDVRERLGELSRQVRAAINLHIVCDRRFAKHHEAELIVGSGAVKFVTLHTGQFSSDSARFDGVPTRNDRMGPLLKPVLAVPTTPLVAFLDVRDSLFSDHFASLAKTLSDQPEAMFACSGMISRSRDLAGEQKCRFENAQFTDIPSLLLATGDNQSGRFLYRTALTQTAPEHLLTLLDGETHNYFRLAAAVSGPLAQSNYTSYVYEESLVVAMEGEEPVEQQRQYIRDAFARDPRWLMMLGTHRDIPQAVYSTGPATPIRWTDYSAPFEITHQIPLGRRLSAAAGGTALPYLMNGFSPPEAEHSWLAGERGVVSFSIGAAAKASFEDHELVLRVRGRRSVETGREQHCHVAINGKFVAYLRVPEHETEVHVPIPPMALRGARNVQMEIVPDHSEPVLDENGTIVDPRRLSIMLRSMILIPRSFAPPMFGVGEIYKTIEGERGAEALAQGFHLPEPNLTWVAGAKGALRFILDSQPVRPRLVLRLSGRNSVVGGTPQKVAVKVGGKREGVFILKEGMHDYAIDLAPEQTAVSSLWVEVEAHHAEAVFDESHNVVDGRLLGVAIGGVGVLERGEGWRAVSLESAESDEGSGKGTGT